jgi:hypothetical protein
LSRRATALLDAFVLGCADPLTSRALLHLPVTHFNDELYVLLPMSAELSETKVQRVLIAH